MAQPGGVPTQSPGATSDMILGVVGDVITDGVLRLRFPVMGMYRAKYYAIFVNGIYPGRNYYAAIDQPFCEALLPLTSGNRLGSLYIEDAGDWAAFDDYVPAAAAEAQDSLTANRLLIEWNAATSYTQTEVYGDTQVDDIVVTGAKRGSNVALLDGFTTRGQLSYSITSVGTTRIVRWWNGSKMVAEGSRVGNGAVTCDAVNGSGVTVTCILTYTGDLAPGIAMLNLLWPAAYQIHYDVDPLVFPRTPEATVLDTGADNYLYLTPTLDGGTYNFNVLTVDDADDVQDAMFPVTETQEIDEPPAAPTNLSVSGDASALLVEWDVGEAGCTYTVYASLVGEPVNFGNYALPAPIVTALDATDATLAAVINYAAVSTAAALATLESDFDAAIATCNAVFNAGEAGFDDAFATLLDDLKAAIDTYQDEIGLRLNPFKSDIDNAAAMVTAQVAAFDGVFVTADWQNMIGVYYGTFLGFLGDVLTQDPGRYTMPNGAVGGGATGSAAVGTGPNVLDGSTARTLSSVRFSLANAAEPLSRPGKIRIVVRASKGGVQEVGDAQYEVEFDDTGDIVTPRPNQAHIQTISFNGLQVSVYGKTLLDDAPGTPTILDLYVVAMPAAFVLGTPQASGALTNEGTGAMYATLNYTVGAAGWYRIGIAARTADGARSEIVAERIEYLNATNPPAVTDLSAKVLRGRGNRIG